MNKIIKTLIVILVLALAITVFVACNKTEDKPAEPTEPPCEHSWDEASCESAKTCAFCGLVEGEALGHDIVQDPAIPATCKAEGREAGSHCSRCDAKTVVGATIEKLAHTEVADPKVEPTCTEPGKEAGSHCSVCNEVIVAQKEIKKVPHKLATVTTLPTASAAGQTVGTCSVCKNTFSYGEVQAMGVGTYVLDGANEALAGIAQYSLSDGEVRVAGGVFECHLSNKYRTDANQKKTFPDDYFGTDRLNFGGQTEIDSEKNPDIIKNGIVFTATEAATVTIWWVEGGEDHRQVALYDMEGNIVVQSNEQELAKGAPCVTTFTVEAGSYIIGNVINTNYIFKVEVVVGTPAVEPEA